MSAKREREVFIVSKRRLTHAFSILHLLSSKLLSIEEEFAYSLFHTITGKWFQLNALRMRIALSSLIFHRAVVIRLAHGAQFFRDKGRDVVLGRVAVREGLI